MTESSKGRCAHLGHGSGWYEMNSKLQQISFPQNLKSVNSTAGIYFSWLLFMLGNMNPLGTSSGT